MKLGTVLQDRNDTPYFVPIAVLYLKGTPLLAEPPIYEL